MKTLSYQQPWAWLIAHRYKPCENRGWSTNVRGPTLVHASKKFDHEGYEWVRDTFPEIPLPPVEAFERGGIVGRVTITDCVTRMHSKWAFGPFIFTLADGEPLPFFAVRGQLNFFDVEYGSGDGGKDG